MYVIFLKEEGTTQSAKIIEKAKAFRCVTEHFPKPQFVTPAASPGLLDFVFFCRGNDSVR